jgi:hypothetical protein
MPPWPIAMPSSTAMVLNSRGTRRRPRWPRRRCGRRLQVGVAGHELGEAVGHRDDRFADVGACDTAARSSERAPAMLRPWVTVRDLSSAMHRWSREGPHMGRRY